MCNAPDSKDALQPDADPWGQEGKGEGNRGQKYGGGAEEDHGCTWLSLIGQYQLTGPLLGGDWTTP